MFAFNIYIKHFRLKLSSEIPFVSSFCATLETISGLWGALITETNCVYIYMCVIWSLEPLRDADCASSEETGVGVIFFEREKGTKTSISYPMMPSPLCQCASSPLVLWCNRRVSVCEISQCVFEGYTTTLTVLSCSSRSLHNSHKLVTVLSFCASSSLKPHQLRQAHRQAHHQQLRLYKILIIIIIIRVWWCITLPDQVAV